MSYHLPANDISRWVSTAEYGRIGTDEQSLYFKIKYLRDNQVTYKQIREKFDVSDGTITAAVKAIKDDRPPGKNGKPRTLKLDEEMTLFEIICSIKATGKSIKLKDFRTLV